MRRWEEKAEKREEGDVELACPAWTEVVYPVYAGADLDTFGVGL